MNDKHPKMNLEQVSFYAKIANISYILPKRRQEYIKDNLPNLVYDMVDSDEHQAVLLDNSKKIVYISVRGTELGLGYKRAFEDLIQDSLVSLRLTLNSRRFNHIEKVLLRIMKKYPRYKIVLSGHSLGSSISSELSKKYNIESHNFSTGSGRRSLMDFDPREKQKYDKNKIHYYHTPEFDLLSSSSKILPGKHYYIPKKPGLSSHSLNNFIL